MPNDHSCNKCRHARTGVWRGWGIRWPFWLSDADQWVCNSPSEQEKTRSRVTGKTKRGSLPRCRDKTCAEVCDEWEKSKTLKLPPGRL